MSADDEIARLEAEISELNAQYATPLRRLKLREDRASAAISELASMIADIEERADKKRRDIRLGAGIHRYEEATRSISRRLRVLYAQREEARALSDLHTPNAQKVKILRDYWASNGFRLRSGTEVFVPYHEAHSIVAKGIAAFA